MTDFRIEKGSNSSIAIGTHITGGGANEILYEDFSQNLAASSLLQFDGVGTLSLYGNGGGAGVKIDVGITNPSSATTITTLGDNYPIYIYATPLYIYDPSSSTRIATFGGGSSSINDSSGILSGDFQNRHLTDSGGTMMIDWLNMVFYSPTNHTQCLAFDPTGNAFIYLNLNLAEASNLVLGTTTGTKFGTATTQKLGFFNATPVVQQSGSLVTAMSNLGLVTSATFPAASISGVLGTSAGGTSFSSFTQGDILYANSPSDLALLNDVAVGSVLVSGGVSGNPAWSASPTITTSITCPIHIGGTTTTSTLTLRATSASAASGAAVIFQSDSGKEVARTSYNGTFNLFGVGKTPTAFLDVTGATPATVAGTGTTATNTFNVLGASGGDTSGTAGPTGGIGALFSVTGGTGGNASSASSGTGTGGAGGAGTIAGGSGNNTSGSSTIMKGGAGGALNLNGGAGGNGSVSSGFSVLGGNGGNTTLTSGNGGTATVGSANTGTGGNGGALTLTPGTGGKATTSSGTPIHGAAGTLTLNGGTGGGDTSNAANGIAGGLINVQGGTGGGTTTGTSGAGGGLTLSGGVAGSNSGGTSGAGGIITFKTALTTSLITAGTIDTSQNWNLNTKVVKYNNIATVSNGIPSELATIDLTAQTANIGASTLYAVPASGVGMYRISSYVVETTAGSVSSTLPNVQVVYTDNDTAGSITMDATPILGIAGIGQTGALTANTIGTASAGVIVINVKASTTIQYQTVNYASSLAGMAYAIHIKIEAL